MPKPLSLKNDKPILILGGTAEAFLLAQHLVQFSSPIISSLAGRTKNPKLPPGKTRIGGFGGIDALAKFLITEKISIVIDATHPFARTITHHALLATKRAHCMFLRLERPSWQAQPGDRWIFVTKLAHIALHIPACSRVFLAIGRQYLHHIPPCCHVRFIARMIEPPEYNTLSHLNDLRIFFEKPGSLEQEIQFLREHQIDLIVCRNSGGDSSYQKILAARKLGLTVIMLQQNLPPLIPTLPNVTDVIEFLAQHHFLQQPNPAPLSII